MALSIDVKPDDPRWKEQLVCLENTDLYFHPHEASAKSVILHGSYDVKTINLHNGWMALKFRDLGPRNIGYIKIQEGDDLSVP